MINLYLDQEYDCPTETLISVALVGDDGREFYEVVDGALVTDDWVKKNVMPILNKDGISLTDVKFKLADFLKKYRGKELTIHADWPADIAYFCRLLEMSPGVALSNTKRNFTFKLNRDLSSGESKIPHNALEDARAIMESALEAETN